jgi:glycine betaine/proline transport system substrate-binding protein
MKFLKHLLLCGALGAALVTAWPVAADQKPTIKIGYVEGWDDSVATTNVAARIIEKRLGYPVQIVPVAAGMMWEGVARGDLDATLSAWLPVTHAAYYDQFKSKVEDVGANFQDARIGLIVPADLPENSIPELAGHQADFGGRIVGIDAGAGVMKKTDEAIKAYNLNYQLMPSSGSAMTSDVREVEAEVP